MPTVLPRALPRPPVTSVTLATPDVSVVVREVVEVPDVVAPVSTEPVAALLVVPPTPAGQAAAPSETPEFVE